MKNRLLLLAGLILVLGAGATEGGRVGGFHARPAAPGSESEGWLKLTWARLLGGDNVDHPETMTAGADGTIYLAGYTASRRIGGIKAGPGSSFLARYGADGRLLQLRLLGTEFAVIAVGDDGSLYTAGHQPDPRRPGAQFIAVRRLNPGGEVMWKRILPGRGREEATAIAVARDGSVYVTGVARGFPRLPPSVSGLPNYWADVFLARYSAAGSLEWKRTIRGRPFAYATALAAGEGGVVYLTGMVHLPHPFSPINFRYDEQLPPLSDLREGGTVFLARFGPARDREWTRFLAPGGQAVPTALALDASGDAYLGGWTSTPLAGQQVAGDRDLFVARYIPTGTREWVRLVGGPDDDYALALATGPGGIVYVTGGTEGPLFRGRLIAGANDVFLLALDPDGALRSLRLLGGAGGEVGEEVAILPDGSPVVAGTALGPTFVDRPTRHSDLFLLRFTAVGP